MRGSVRRPESDDDPPPGVRRWLISCDETGVHGARFYGFGSLWMPWQRRGDFAALVQRLRDEHAYHHEIKWTNVKRRSLDFYMDLVETFFSSSWLWFHCLLVEKSVVRKELHGGDYDLARRKHLTMLLTNKVRRALRAHPARQQTFRVWVDPIHSRYAKADEAVEVIGNNVLAATARRKDSFDGVYSHASRETPSIQVSDLFVGAVASSWEREAVAEAKLDLQTDIAWHLSWPDLMADTKPDERKFNIWVFHDPTRGPRRSTTRRVVLHTHSA
jgi:hypothetical protein